jgi:hypothetical protein
MQGLICAIEREMKHISDSEEGSRQYRKGYFQGLEVVRDILNVLSPETWEASTIEDEPARSNYEGAADTKPTLSFAIAGVTRVELSQLELCLDLLRTRPEEMAGVLDSMHKIDGARFTPGAGQSFDSSGTFEIVGTKLRRVPRFTSGG